ncbi:secreted protein containing Dystroglycan-type cadherin-like domain protein [Candidatus Magnetomorum sp. HK-1]|nr:secreted protein containing Dystroglycan-type cadherin-like domain protein [Candidatus Magnetomorum sp. HK-1]
MKRSNTIFITIIFIVSIFGCVSNLYAVEPGPVQSLRSVSHVINSPSQNAVIQMSWGLPANTTEIRGYYTVFNSEQYFVLTEENTLNIQPISTQETVSVDYGDVDDINIYFHIAATSTEDEIGETVTFGPIRIDTVPPSNPVLVTSPFSTSQIIRLILGANNAIEMYISNTAHGVGGQWEPLVSPKTWELTEGQGLKTIYVQFRDRADNRTKSITSLSLDTIPPSVSISSEASYQTNVSPLTINILFSEPVTDLKQSELYLNNCLINSLTGSDDKYVLVVTPAGAGEVSVQVPEGKAFDIAGNGNDSSDTLVRVYDPSPPQVTLSTNTPQYMKEPSLSVDITFSESVKDFDMQDLQTVNVLEVTSFTGSGSEYQLNVIPENQGTIEISIPENVGFDDAGNGNTLSETLARYYDSVSPSISITSSTRETTNMSPIPITIVFNEEVKGFESTDIVTYATVKNFYALDNVDNYAQTFICNLIPPGQGEISVQIAENAAIDHAGNGNMATQPFIRNYDLTQPDVNIEANVSSITNQSTITCTANFTSDVVALDKSDIVLTNAEFVGDITGSGKVYTFDISPQNEGLISVFIPEDNVFSISGNTNRNSNTLELTYDIYPPLFTLKTVANQATSISPIPVTLLCEEPFTGLIASDIQTQGVSDLLNFSVQEQQATFSVVPENQGLLTVSILSGVFSDLAGNSNAMTAALKIGYDTNSPTVEISSSTTEQVAVSPIPISVIFSEAVNDFILSDLSVTNAQASNLRIIDGDSSIYLIDLVPTVQGEITVSVPSGIATDNAGNNNDASSPFQRFYASEYPTVTISSNTPEITDLSSIPINIVFSDVMTGFESSDLIISNGVVDQFNGSDMNYSCNIIPNEQGIVTIHIPENAAIDAAGLGNTASAQLIRTFDYNDSPVAFDGTLSFNEDTSGNYILKASDVDEKDSLTYSIIDQINGDVNLNALTGELTYTPESNFSGQRVIKFKANDGLADSNTASLTITVLPVNDPPVLNELLSDQTILEDVYFEYSLPYAFIDMDENDSLSYVAQLSNGSELPSWLTFDPYGPSFTGTPENSDIANYQIKVKATDTSGVTVSDSFSLTVVNVNDLPELSIITNVEMYENKIFQTNLSVSDIDAEFLSIKAISGNETLISNTDILIFGDGLSQKDDLSYTIRPGPSGFSDLTLTIKPLQNQFGTTQLTLLLSDEFESITSMVTVNVQAVRYTLSGRVDYFKDNHPISNVTIVLTGGETYTTTTNEDGLYNFSNIPTGDYTVEASRSLDNLDESVSPMDASIIARSIVGLESLDCYQLIAADVSKNADTSSMDTSMVARYSAGLISELNTSNIHWTFINEPIMDCSHWAIPINDYKIEYSTGHKITDLKADLQDINLIAVRLGDVTGNWPDNHMRKRQKKRNNTPIILSKKVGETFQLPVTLSSSNTIYGLEIIIQYNPNYVKLVNANKEQTIFSNSDYELVKRDVYDGTDTFIVHTTSDLISSSGNVLMLTFEAQDKLVETPITIQKFIVNEDLSDADGGFAANSKSSYAVNLVINPLAQEKVSLVDAIKAFQQISKGNVQEYDLKRLIGILRLCSGFDLVVESL